MCVLKTYPWSRVNQYPQLIPSIDTWLTPPLTLDQLLHWQSVESWLIFADTSLSVDKDMSQLTLGQLLTNYWPSVDQDIDQCRLSIDVGVQQVLIETKGESF